MRRGVFRLRQRWLAGHFSSQRKPSGRERRGSDEPPLQEQPGRNFHGRNGESGAARGGWACGVTIGDYNNDGFDDLFVTYWGQNVLYRNNGDGTFTDVTKEAGLWREGALGLRLHFSGLRPGRLPRPVLHNYLDFDLSRAPKPGRSSNCNWKGVPVNCGPRGLPKGTEFSLSQRREGHFTDVSEKAGRREGDGAYGLTAIGGGSRRRRLAGPLRGVRLDANHFYFATGRRELCGGGAGARYRGE